MKNTILTGLVLITMLLIPCAVYGQDETVCVTFMGRADTNGDQQISLEDSLTLFQNCADKTVTLTKPDFTTQYYDFNSEINKLAIIGLKGGQSTLLITSPDEGAQPIEVNLADFKPEQVVFATETVWLAGLNGQKVPEIRGFNATDGTVIGKRPMRLATTKISLHSQGHYALAYNRDAGILAVFSLPSFESVTFDVTGYALTEPIWSPVAERFAIASGDMTNHNDDFMQIVDFASKTTTRIDLPDSPDAEQFSAYWSDNGQYVVYKATDKKGIGDLRLVNTADETVTTVSTPSKDNLTTVAWGINDSIVLLRTVPSELDTTPEFLIYELASGFKTVDAFTQIEGTAFAWSPTQPQLAMLGQSLLQGLSGLYVTPIDGSDMVTVFESPDPKIAEGSLDWSTTGQTLFYTAGSDDAVQTSFREPIALYRVSAAGGEPERISPENVSVELNTIHP